MLHSFTSIPAIIFVAASMLTPLVAGQDDPGIGPKGGSIIKWPPTMSAAGLHPMTAELNPHAGPKGGVTDKWLPYMSPMPMSMSTSASAEGRGPKGGPVGRWH